MRAILYVPPGIVCLQSRLRPTLPVPLDSVMGGCVLTQSVFKYMPMNTTVLLRAKQTVTFLLLMSLLLKRLTSMKCLTCVSSSQPLNWLDECTVGRGLQGGKCIHKAHFSTFPMTTHQSACFLYICLTTDCNIQKIYLLPKIFCCVNVYSLLFGSDSQGCKIKTKVD